MLCVESINQVMYVYYITRWAEWVGNQFGKHSYCPKKQGKKGRQAETQILSPVDISKKPSTANSNPPVYLKQTLIRGCVSCS